MSAVGSYKLGFTGTRKGMTVEQKAEFRWVATLGRVTEFHHGACVGADVDADWIISQYQEVQRHVHPGCSYDGNMPFFVEPKIGAIIYKPRRYLHRNKVIVDSTDRLIACPDGPEKVRSGTWSTIRYAMEQGKPVYIIYPDGSVEIR